MALGLRQEAGATEEGATCRAPTGERARVHRLLRLPRPSRGAI